MWVDVPFLESKVSAMEIQLLKRIFNVKKGTCNNIIFYELRRPNIVTKIMDRQYAFFQKLFSLSEDDAVIRCYNNNNNRVELSKTLVLNVELIPHLIHT